MKNLFLLFFLFPIFYSCNDNEETPIQSEIEKDWRHISNGKVIYEHGYCDQPYIVTTNDGIWVCTFTTSPMQEGNKIQ